MMRAVLLAAAAALLTGCTAAPPCRNNTQLFFGAAIGEGGERVDDAAWRSFVEASVLPRFPDGFTVMDAQGLWRSPQSGRVVTEPSRVLMVLHADDAASNARLDEIATDYKTRFRQDAVLRLDQCGAYRF